MDTQIRFTSSLDDILDSGRINAAQSVIVFCAALAVVFDGMDIQLMSFAIPAIAKAWHLTRPAFAPVLAAGLFGVAIGAICGGMVGDLIGRKRALLINIFVFSLATLSVAKCESVNSMIALRFLAGCGIGGALPNATTLSSEFTPLANRALAVGLTAVCVPLGGLLAGLISARTLPQHSWQLLFVIGGVLPLILLVLLMVVLPESPKFLASKPSRHSELVGVLERIHRPIPASMNVWQSKVQDSSIGNSAFRDLFGGGVRQNTLLLWLSFFLCLTTAYLAVNWLPSVLVGDGMGVKDGSAGLAGYNFGGVVGAVALAFWINARGSKLPTLVASAGGAVTALLVAVVVAQQHTFSTSLLILIIGHGLFVNALMTALYAVAAQMYVTRVRATGVAAALSIGRIGAILSAYFGGHLLSFPAANYFVILAVGMVTLFAALSLLKGHLQAPTTVDPLQHSVPNNL